MNRIKREKKKYRDLDPESCIEEFKKNYNSEGLTVPELIMLMRDRWGFDLSEENSKKIINMLIEMYDFGFMRGKAHK